LGLVALLNRSHNTVPASGDWFTEWWSVAYSGNIVEDAPAPMPNEEAYDRLNEAFASSGDNGGDVAERRSHPGSIILPSLCFISNSTKLFLQI
jgi:hypothetical protein